MNDLQSTLRWRSALELDLLAADGPLSLAGIYRLPEGLTTVGGASDRDLRLARELHPPAQVGTFTYGDQLLLFTPDSGCPAVLGNRVLSGTVRLELADEPLPVEVGPLQLIPRFRSPWVFIEVRSPLAPYRTDFGGLRWYPWDSPALVTGWLEGSQVTFELNGRSVEWKAHREAKTLWRLDFSDATSGVTTSPYGRQLHFSAPTDGRILLDFNRAITPAAGRTPFGSPEPAGNFTSTPLFWGEKHPHSTLSQGSGI